MMSRFKPEFPLRSPAMAGLRSFILLLALVLGAHSAETAEVVYPPGSRLGLIPPSGMATSNNFFGFEDADNHAAIILAALPIEAYAELERTAGSEASCPDVRSCWATRRQTRPRSRLRTCSSASRPAARPRPASARHLRATCSAACPTCATSALSRPSLCASPGRQGIRSWLRRGIRQ